MSTAKYTTTVSTFADLIQTAKNLASDVGDITNVVAAKEISDSSRRNTLSTLALKNGTILGLISQMSGIKANIEDLHEIAEKTIVAQPVSITAYQRLEKALDDAEPQITQYRDTLLNLQKNIDELRNKVKRSADFPGTDRSTGQSPSQSSSDQSTAMRTMSKDPIVILFILIVISAAVYYFYICGGKAARPRIPRNVLVERVQSNPVA